MNIWRLTINPSSEEGVDPRKLCIEENILGFGWHIESSEPVDWATYERKASEKYTGESRHGWWPAVNAIYNRMAIGDLCWTRNWDGEYYLGRIEGPWEYRGDEQHRSADIVNLRPCQWVYIGTDDAVPGKVKNSFRASRTLQAIHDETTSIYSKFLYNKQGRSSKYSIPFNREDLDIFSLISPEDCEDVVGLYLQELHGWRLIPSTCKYDTSKYEFILRKGNKKALVQVKQGKVELNRDGFRRENRNPCTWFLFTTCGIYLGEELDNVQCLDPQEILNFMNSNRDLMPDRIKYYLEFCEELA